MTRSVDGRGLPYSLLAFFSFIAVVLVIPAYAQRYDTGTPQMTDVWIDPAGGNDAASGVSRTEALRTLTEAWNRIPANTTLERGVRILILPGRLPEESIPNYLENRHGTFAAPISIEASSGRGTVTLAGDLNVFDVRYLYLIDLVIAPDPTGDALHCEKCDHLLIRGTKLDGGDRQAHETVKINQSRYVFIEDSEISGAEDNAIDFVGVQYGHVVRSRIHDAQDWCIYAKGGSAYLQIDSNEIYGCGTGGFTAGQGTGFQFMTSPWIHYEAYDIKVTNNVIHDTEGAGLGVNGGYNILLAHNTLYRVGARSHMVEFVYGNRSCDGPAGAADREACQQFLNQGGWGTTVVDDGTNSVRIPNRNLFFYNNILYNPAGFESPAHFSIAAEYNGATQAGSNVTVPTLADQNLQIRGNVIWNGSPSQSLGIGDDSGCQPLNPSCNESQIRRDNTINLFEPRLVRPSSGDFHPIPGALTAGLTFAIPEFPSNDRPERPLAPPSIVTNRVSVDRDGNVRSAVSTVGAYLDSIPGQVARRRGARAPR